MPIPPVGALIAVVLLLSSAATADAQPAAQGAAAKRAAAQSAALQRQMAEVAAAVETSFITLLADYEYQLGRGIIFQSQGWYPTFTLLHPEQDIVIRWTGDTVAEVLITLLYAKRGIDSGQLLPEQVPFLLPDTEAWFLAVTGRRIAEAVEKKGRGSPTVTWEVLLPLLDAEGEMVWGRGTRAAITPAEAKGDTKALADRIRGTLEAAGKGP